MTAALYYPFSRLHASFAFGGSPPSSVSTSCPTVSTLRFLSPCSLYRMARPSLWILTQTPVPLHAETLSLTSLHVSSEIHSFLCWSLPWGFGTDLRRAAKIPSSLVGSVGGRSGDFRLPAMYRVCSLSGALRTQPTTMKWLVLCRGSRTDTFLKRLLSVPRR